MSKEHREQNERVEQLLARIKESKAAFEREVGSRRKLLAQIHQEIEQRIDPNPDISDAAENAILRGQLARRDLEVSDLRNEVGRASRAIADLRSEQPQGPPDELIAAIDDAWLRLSADYHRYRKQGGEARMEPMRKKRVELEAKASEKQRRERTRQARRDRTITEATARRMRDEYSKEPDHE